MPAHLHFYFDAHATHWPDLEQLSVDDIARAPHRFVGGRNSWIAQTYVRLRRPLEARGWTVTAGSRHVPGSITLAHRDDANEFLSGAFRSFLVIVRADRQPAMACDLAIVQNGIGAMAHERFVPLWPQPGLVPRDVRRGTAISRIAYMGRLVSPPAWFSDPALHAALAERNIRFEIRTSGWERYDDVDVVVAARDEVPTVLATKPATKLYNGWIAGVPVLAAPEPAYEELRRSSLDFLRVESARDVLAGIDRLRAQPALYRAMVANGHARAPEFDVASITARWCDLLEREALPRHLRSHATFARRAVWFVRAMAEQKARSKRYRNALALERFAAAP
jgi:hypothetical protein